MGNKKDIGKGIRALLGEIDNKGIENEDLKTEVVKEFSSNTANLPIEKIIVNPEQPRKEFDEKELLELTQSIKSYGLIQPITVRKIGDEFQIISGERRYRASKLAGLKEVPVYIRIADDQAMLEMALVENIQRAELNAMEIAFSYHRLLEECQLNHEELALRVGKERSTVSNYVRLLKLPPQVQTSIKEGGLSMGHARAISGLENQSHQLQLFKQIVNKNLSVRATESLVREWKNKTVKKSSAAKSRNNLSPELMNIKDRLTHLFGNKTEIKRSEKGIGTLTIHFRSDDDFNSILDIIED